MWWGVHKSIFGIRNYQISKHIVSVISNICPPSRVAVIFWVEVFWSKEQRSNFLIELQGSNGMRSKFIVFVVWLGRFAPFAK